MSTSPLPPAAAATEATPDPVRRQLLVLTALGLVHAASAEQAAAQRASGSGGGSGSGADNGGIAHPGGKLKPGSGVPAGVIVGHDPAGLPPAVADMRSAILAAVESGQIEELRYAIDLNELKPDFGSRQGSDVIAHLKAISGDGNGREILAILGRLLDSSYAAIPGGRDIENNRIYVWPHFAEVSLMDLSPAQEVAIYRLIAPAELRAMRDAGRWAWWRLAIGADGVWHSFVHSGR